MKGLLSGWGLAARPCDNCHTASALLYCSADTAFLCGPCDSKVHVANCHGVVTVRHERVWMCEVCEQAPATVTCKADAAVLCSSCDHDIHSANPLARRHERVPVVPFLDLAVDAVVRSSSTAANPSTFLDPVSITVPVSTTTPVTVPAPTKFDDDADAWLIPNLNNTFMYNEPELLNFSNFGQNREKIGQQQSYESPQSYAFTDSVVPTQSNGNLSFKNNNNNKSSDHVFVNSFEINFSQSEKHNSNKLKNNNDQHMELFSSLNFSAQQSVSSSDIGVVPEANTNSISEASYTFGNSVTSSAAGDSSSPTGATAVPTLDRAARVLRYREKRKNRKFEKTIRYASRKAYAETRPRIKGRFVKRTGNNNETPEIDNMFGSSLASGLGSNFDFVLEGYGVVPTF